jgi:hypothetical protein
MRVQWTRPPVGTTRELVAFAIVILGGALRDRRGDGEANR